MAEYAFEVVGELPVAPGSSSTVTITVADPPAPVEYAAAGITSCDINAESILALAMRPRTTRLTHDDQISRPGRTKDEGFIYADQISKGQFVFFTKNKQKSQ